MSVSSNSNGSVEAPQENLFFDIILGDISSSEHKVIRIPASILQNLKPTVSPSPGAVKAPDAPTPLKENNPNIMQQKPQIPLQSPNTCLHADNSFLPSTPKISTQNKSTTLTPNIMKSKALSTPSPQSGINSSLPSTPIISMQNKSTTLTPNIMKSMALSTPSQLGKRAAQQSPITFVFFDLETTGLPREMGAENVQITELSMVAIKRSEFERSMNKDLNDIRVVNKLLLCIKPRSYVSYGAAKITGLNTEDLNQLQPFDSDIASSIVSFLKRLPKPICMLAHNGRTFDFPLLKSEMQRLSVSLPEDVYLADTLEYFREMGVPVTPPGKKICKSVKYNRGKLSYALENLHVYFFNKKPTGGHSAEVDCISLTKVCSNVKDSMLPWIDDNVFTMDDVKAMW